jgi:hypothetical protein
MLFVTFYLPRAVEAFCVADRAVFLFGSSYLAWHRLRKPYITAHGTPTACLPSIVFGALYWNRNGLQVGSVLPADVSALEILALITGIEDRPLLAGDDSHGQNCPQNGTYILYNCHGPVLGFQTEDELPANQEPGEGSH